jgi:hypothetical protein
MSYTIGDGHHQTLAQYDENGNFMTNYHTHQHTWPGNSTTVAPSSGWIGGSGDYTDRLNYHNFTPADIHFNTREIMIENRHLTKVIEDMAILLKMIVEKYDLHEVKKLVEETEVAIWAHDGKYREDLVEEKKEHLDEKLFEI